MTETVLYFIPIQYRINLTFLQRYLLHNNLRNCNLSSTRIGMVSLFTMFDLSEQRSAEFERERSHNECSGACEFLTLGGRRRQAVTPPLQS